MSSINTAINSWIQNGGDPEKLTHTKGKPLTWKKNYLSYKEKTGWKVVELNVFQRIIRVIGGYGSTRPRLIKAKLKDANLNEFSAEDKKMKKIYQHLLKIIDPSFVPVPTQPTPARPLDGVLEGIGVVGVAPSYVGEDVKKTDAVFKRTDQVAVNKIYDTLETLDSVLREIGVEYCMCGGTQLGATRQTGVDGKGPGGLIPWDDDGDIAILEQDLGNMIAMKDRFDKLGYELVEHEYCWKLQPKDGTAFDPKDEIGKNGETIRFPFIDIFIMDKQPTGDQDKYYIANPAAYKQWSYEYYSEEEWQGITDVQFGHLKLRGLKGVHAKAYLDRGYCDKNTKEPTWRNEAARWWDHENAEWQGMQILKLVDRTHSVATPVVDHQAVARVHLDTLSDKELDADWQLSEFFGHSRILNLDINPARLQKAKEHLRAVGSKDEFSERFRGIYGRTELSEEVWSRIDSNYKRYDVNDPAQAAKLERQHQGQAGCFVSHHGIVKETREKYYQAKRKYEQAVYDFKYNDELPLEERQKALDSALVEVQKYSSVVIIEDDNGFGIVDTEKDVVSIGSYGVKDTQIKVTGKRLDRTGTGRILRKAVANLPKDWNMLYFLAMDYEGGEDVGKEHLLKLKQGILNNCYVVNANFYDTFVQHTGVIEESSAEKVKAFDEHLMRIHPENKCYVIQPPIAIQDGGGSDINGTSDDETYWQCHI